MRCTYTWRACKSLEIMMENIRSPPALRQSRWDIFPWRYLMSFVRTEWNQPPHSSFSFSKDAMMSFCSPKEDEREAEEKQIFPRRLFFHFHSFIFIVCFYWTLSLALAGPPPHHSWRRFSCVKRNIAAPLTHNEKMISALNRRNYYSEFSMGNEFTSDERKSSPTRESFSAWWWWWWDCFDTQRWIHSMKFTAAAVESDDEPHST